VFNRGFIRAIARFLGLDEDSLVAEYAIETRDAAPPRIEPEYSGASRRKPWAAIAIVGVLLAALVAGSWFIVARYGARIGAFFHGQRASSNTAALTAVLTRTSSSPILLHMVLERRAKPQTWCQH
jgi:cytoskeletal protein RodZ